MISYPFSVTIKNIFADIQLEAADIYSDVGKHAERLVRQLVEEVQPDLITLTGDNFLCKAGLIRWIRLLDSFGIPWAPVMGNHDGDNGKDMDEKWISWRYMNASKNCVFKAGPTGMGYGNYVICITENGEVIHTLFMMDTHSDAEDTENGVINYAPDGSAHYDHLWEKQIGWYEWCVKGIEESAGHAVESTAFMHIPVYQYKAVQNTMTSGGRLLPEYASFGSGVLRETVCSPLGDNGFFAKAKELSSTTMMVFGHDHINNMMVSYDGIRLNYAQKSSYGCYWDDDMLGGSVITVDSDGHSDMVHVDYRED